MGDIVCARLDWSAVHHNPFFSADPNQIPLLEQAVTTLREQGDSVGARLYVEATGVPPGWGEPVFDRLDADLAKALMSINAVKGVEIGDGMAVATMRGTEHRDEMTPQGFTANHSGGVSGGISTGQTVYARYAIKPTSSITTPGRSINSAGEAVDMRTTGRHDPCVGLRATPIGEAMMALVLIDHALRHRAQNADVSPATPRLPAEPQP
jgi:chorismate synthase